MGFLLFVKKLSNIMNKHTSLRTYHSSENLIKPWITKNLLRCIRKRDRLHIKAKTENIDNHIIQKEYKNYRNYCNNILTNLKINYERESLMKTKGQSKKLGGEI